MIWRLNKSFTSFIGKELLDFVKYIPSIIKLLKDNLGADSDDVKNICKGLRLWNVITPFLVISQIEDAAKYEAKLLDFEANLKLFYIIGAKTFFTKSTIGDEENFYSHYLRFYMLHIARELFESHVIGLGIFTMQGFERRNKESKNTFKRFNNRKGNMLVQNLKRLSDVFRNRINNY